MFKEEKTIVRHFGCEYCYGNMIFIKESDVCNEYLNYEHTCNKCGRKAYLPEIYPVKIQEEVIDRDLLIEELERRICELEDKVGDFKL